QSTASIKEDPVAGALIIEISRKELDETVKEVAPEANLETGDYEFHVQSGQQQDGARLNKRNINTEISVTPVKTPKPKSPARRRGERGSVEISELVGLALGLSGAALWIAAYFKLLAIGMTFPVGLVVLGIAIPAIDMMVKWFHARARRG